MHVCGKLVGACIRFWVLVCGAVGCKVCGNFWVHVCGFWVHVCGNGWAQSMRLLGAKYAVVGCKSMETFGCMYAVVGCKYAETFGCMCAEVGCKFQTAESLPDSR